MVYSSACAGSAAPAFSAPRQPPERRHDSGNRHPLIALQHRAVFFQLGFEGLELRVGGDFQLL